MNEEKKGLTSRWDRIWLIVVGLILLFIVLSKFGVNMAYHSESTELTSNTDDGGKVRHAPRQHSVIESRSDYDLGQIALAFSESNLDDLSYYGLDETEVNFYERIYEAYENNSRIDSEGDWLRVLKRVQRIYINLGEIYQEHKVRKAPGKDAFADIESLFGVSMEKCRDFADRYGGDQLDWALFIDRER